MLILAGLLFGLLSVGWIILFAVSRPRYTTGKPADLEGIRLQAIAPPMLYLLDQIAVSRRLPIFFYKIQRSITKISGGRRGGEHTLLFLAEMLSYTWLLLTLGCLMSLLTQGSDGLIIGTMLAFLLPAALIHDLHKKVVRREQEMLLELPELLNKIILLVGAGSTVQQAIRTSIERKGEDCNHPLYRELRQMQREWDGGYSFQQAMEGFSRRCGIQEISAFATAVLLNFRRGGNDFVLALMDLSRSLWERRKAICKTLGEQASSKLIFPMVLLFLVVVILVGAPAFMMMNL
ncbi:type II secretion system F family protein [Paenibacillus antibioticophila]|uniref:type II secretion system F family protein n=1 Tax=Paenibacillus antibioticophila TaxID=1274374 RepID=UPI0005CB6B3A|nr:type II secretion system F family protein [Paenibacillus antibioticophila]